MESEDTPTPEPSQSGDPLSGEEVRRATFPQALRGYDRQAVHDMLDRVADWMEGKADAVSSARPDMRQEFEKVGEKTAGILTAAEEAARNLRDEAAEYAERLRSDAEDESRKARLNASQRMDEMIAEAETKARGIIDEAVARRRQLNQAISSLIDRRDEIAADATRLAEELLGAVEDLRTPPAPVESEFEADPDATQVHEPESEEIALREPESEEIDFREPDSEETEIHEPDSDEAEVDEVDPDDGERQPPTLLVDPDAQDDTPPHGPTR
jgi:DivIVA domain-containing protein